MRKIVASDYDGTLYQGGISADTVEMIQKFRAEGNLFGIVTGRDYIKGIKNFHEMISFDFIISHNGAVAYDSDANLVGIPLGNIWTAGDNYNDISMLKTYHGCAMTNGVESAAQVANVFATMLLM